MQNSTASRIGLFYNDFIYDGAILNAIVLFLLTINLSFEY